MKKEGTYRVITENGEKRIQYYPSLKISAFIPGLIFMLIVVSVIFLSDKPWEREKRQAEAKIRAERLEQFRSEKLDDFFSDCRIEYSKDYLEGHEIDFENFASIIKNAEVDAEHPYRSRFFGHIHFIGYGKGGYVNVSICEGDPATSHYYGHYASKELLEWAKKTFPEVFEEIKEYEAQPSFRATSKTFD